MKKLVLCLTVAAFAAVPAVFAGGPDCSKEQTSACSASKAKTTAVSHKTGSQCSAEAKVASSSGCCPVKAARVRTIQQSKGAMLLVMK